MQVRGTVRTAAETVPGVGGQYVLQHVQRGALAVVLLDRRHAQVMKRPASMLPCAVV